MRNLRPDQGGEGSAGETTTLPWRKAKGHSGQGSLCQSTDTFRSSPPGPGQTPPGRRAGGSVRRSQRNPHCLRWFLPGHLLVSCCPRQLATPGQPQPSPGLAGQGGPVLLSPPCKVRGLHPHKAPDSPQVHDFFLFCSMANCTCILLRRFSTVPVGPSSH